MDRSGARGQIALVPFIQARDQGGAHDCNGRPAWSPWAAIHAGKSFPPGTKQQDAEERVSEDVSALAQESMPRFEAGVVNPKQKVQHRVKEAAGVLRRQIGRRLDGDDDEPQDQGDPGLQNMVAGVFQLCRESASGLNTGARRPRDSRRAAGATLFDGIVGSFARDHDVVYVALTQAGPADAYESRLLQ